MSKSSAFCAGYAVIILLICGVKVDAAQPSASKMSQMGLSGARVVSDRVALEVRGLGYRGSTRLWSFAKVEVNGWTDVDRDTSGNPVHTFAALPVGGGVIFAGGGAGVRVPGRN